MKEEGKILGKSILTYQSDIKCTYEELINEFAKYAKIELLRCIAFFSHKLFKENKSYIDFFSFPITEDTLLYIARLSIEYGNNHSNEIITDDKLLILFKMSHNFVDNKIRKDIDSIIINYGYKQFIYQENKLYNISRHFFILNDLWKKNSKAAKIDINSAIRSITGNTLKDLIIFSFMLLGNNRGFFFLEEYNDDTLKNGRFGLNEIKFKRFYKWNSIKMDKYLSIGGEINPLIKYPIIDSDITPEKGLNKVSIIPSYFSLFRKCTSNIYFYLCDYFKNSENGNSFKECFGYVLEDYVGFILNRCFNRWQVLPEIEYKIRKKQISKTVDWFVINEDKAVFIEVKQSSLKLSSKLSGDIDSIKSDLLKNVRKAITQFKNTRDAIKSNKYSELNMLLCNISKFEYLVILYDPLFYANYIVKKIFKNEISELGQDIHVINISDFEALLFNQSQSESLFDILQYKNLEDPKSDFNEFGYKIFKDYNLEIDFLQNIYDDVFKIEI